MPKLHPTSQTLLKKASRYLSSRTTRYTEGIANPNETAHANRGARVSHDNDFPEKHGAQRTRTHARPRPAKKPLAAQGGQRIPARRADEHAHPAEAPSRSSEPRTPHVQASGAPHNHAPAEQRMPTSRKPIDSHARRTHVPAERRSSRNQTPVTRCPNINVEALKNRIRHCGRVRCARTRPVRRRALAKHQTHRHHGKRPATAAASHRNR